MSRKNHYFKSKRDAIGRAKKFHFCLDCRYHQTQKYDTCPECGSKNRQYFMSELEMKRGALLLTLQAAGTITNLKFQPRFDLLVNGIKISTYVADASYYNHEGHFVVEDTKPERFMTDLAKMKIKHFEAQYGLQINIPQHKDRKEKHDDLFK